MFAVKYSIEYSTLRGVGDDSSLDKSFDLNKLDEWELL
jgi:hypothetical protein